MKINIAAALLSLLLLFSGCGREEKSALRSAGVVDGEVINILSLTGGTLKALNIQEGDRVTKNQVLAEIDAEKLRLRLEELDIKFREITVNREKILAKKTFLESSRKYWAGQVERLKRLHAKQSVAGDDLRKAELKMEEIQSSLEEMEKTLTELVLKKLSLDNQKKQTELLLKDYTLRSPVNGVVLTRLSSPGENIPPMKPLAEILDGDSLFVETFVEEKDLSRLKLGQSVRIFVDGHPEPLPGTISFFGEEAEFSPKYIISEQERKALLYRVKTNPGESGNILKLGMPVTVEFPELMK